MSAAALPEPVVDAAVDASVEEAAAAARRLGSAESVVAGVLGMVGARALSLDALLRLSAIEWSAEITTACVECVDRPRMLLNPSFVERECATPERLAFLLLHELAHVSMGHTRLFPRPTIAHNIAADAVINRELLGSLVEAGADVPRFAAFLEAQYEADASPAFILRPPPGWPGQPDWDASRACPEPLRAIHRRLYSHDGPPNDAGAWAVSRHGVTYGEIVEALRAAGHVGRGSFAELARLLGAHGATALERTLMSGGRDLAAGEALAEAIGRLTGRMAGAGGDAYVQLIETGRRRSALERALGQALQRAFVAGGTRDGKTFVVPRAVRTVDPRQDRRGPARVALARAFGAPRPLLFDGALEERRPAPRDALVYLDVSGSMSGVLPALHASLVPLRRLLRPRLYLFSTEVVEARAADFDRGRLATTGGTSVNPVLQHLLESTRTLRKDRRVALLLTDGYVGPTDPALAAQVVAAGIRVHVAVAGGGPLLKEHPWVASSTRLP